jgi:hypothetical protein
MRAGSDVESCHNVNLLLILSHIAYLVNASVDVEA